MEHAEEKEAENTRGSPVQAQIRCHFPHNEALLE